MKVTVKNPNTGELKQIKCGWSWTLFFFSGFFGLPLFLRRLYVWGGLFLVLWAINLLGPAVIGDEDSALGLQVLMFFVFLALQIWLAIKGNEMTAKNYLEHGWKFIKPQSDIVRIACGKWGINPPEVMGFQPARG
jgi:hypothetical protein